MQYTSNCNLKKPEGSDPVNINDINDNMDSIDTELKKRITATGGDISNTKIATADSIATEFPVPAAGDAPKTFLGKTKKFAEDFRNLKTGLLTVGMLVNNCVTNNPNLPLSAAQGKVLMDMLTQLNGELKNRFGGISLWDSSAGDNNYLQIIKNKWNTLPDGIYFVRINSMNAAIAIIYKEGMEHGSVYIMGYTVSPPVYSRIIGGDWV